MRTSLLFIAPLLLPACELDMQDEPETSQSQNEIYGGSTTTSNAVGLVNNGSCTGTLISPNTVLSAAHCFLGGSCANTPAATANFRLSGGTNINGQVYINPQHCYDGQINQGDYAIIVLDSDVPGAQPMDISVASMSVGDSLTYQGFGRYGTSDCTNAGNGVLRTTTVTIDNILSGNLSEWYQSYPWQGTGGCAGDSGGPALNSSGDVVGVYSTGTSAAAKSSYSTTAAYGWWLQDNLCERVEAGPTNWSLCGNGGVDCDCSQGEGDCDNSSHCKSGLSCTRDIGGAEGISAGADLCWDDAEVARVYAGNNLTGASRSVVAGSWHYNDLIYSSSNVGNDAISSVDIPDGFAIKAYREGSFWGSTDIFTSSDTNISSSSPVYDNISSLKVLPAVTVFDYPSYSGEKETFTEGTYYVADFNVINNDDISALIAAPGVHVRLCSEQGWGDCQNFNGMVSLSGNSLNQRTSSVQVSLGATVYSAIDFQGTSEAFKVGIYPNSSFEKIANDTISSLIVAPGKSAILCKESNGTGDCQTFTGQVPYVGIDLNDGTSYIRIL